MTYHDVLDLILNSEDVTVGGGSAAALSGAMAAGLIGMVAQLSRGKEYGLPDAEYDAVAQRCRELREMLLEGCVADAGAYGGIIAAYKLPKESDAEKVARRDAIQAAGIQAASVPRDNGVRCREVCQLGQRLQGRSNGNAASDLLYGIGLAGLGIEGCIANIEANLPLIKDETVAAGFRADMQQLGERKEP
jgi:Methenyl tetrahydrofolate cyclohydrolase